MELADATLGLLTIPHLVFVFRLAATSVVIPVQMLMQMDVQPAKQMHLFNQMHHVSVTQDLQWMVEVSALFKDAIILACLVLMD